ncbi:hypothetical protein B7R76_05880 [Mageeibacillus indolicus]|uniref:Uncharacterized protein n=1 Tax=Mageeibacillus indolicus TaxID=884684 RepID=A0A2J8B0U3_9FIRM|nr:hypothetical protein [Mageeibacillus indolicus]PNH18370.1 hypothetical protein B7R76_05880 [Mageeibacillus indolicus]DAR72456.1 MAG TPA: hypothetical protein [Caudoviricetes sp.]
MIKVCRSCLAATLAALILTVPIVADNDPANQAADNAEPITEIQLTLKDGKKLSNYIGSTVTNPKESLAEKLDGYVGEENNRQKLGDGIINNVSFEYVDKSDNPYPDKIFWPIRKGAKGYEYVPDKDMKLKFTFQVGDNNGIKYKVDTTKSLQVSIGDQQFVISENGVKETGGVYTAYLPLHTYRQVKFISDGGLEELYLENISRQRSNASLEFDLDITAGETTFAARRKDLKFKGKDQLQLRAFYVKLPNGNSHYNNTNDLFAFLDLDEKNKENALKPLEVTLKTWNDNDPATIPPLLIGKDATIMEGEKFDPLSLIVEFREKANGDNGDKNKVKINIGDFSSDNPVEGRYKIKMEFGNVTWTSTVIVRAKQKPPVPAPQPQPKQQEKTGNAYFDLGRYLLPTCPDSKCAKIETGAKKDDVPNTAAAVNN